MSSRPDTVIRKTDEFAGATRLEAQGLEWLAAAMPDGGAHIVPVTVGDGWIEEPRLSTGRVTPGTGRGPRPGPAGGPAPGGPPKGAGPPPGGGGHRYPVQPTAGGLEHGGWGATTRAPPTAFGFGSAPHLATAFFNVEPAESFTP